LIQECALRYTIASVYLLKEVELTCPNASIYGEVNGVGDDEVTRRLEQLPIIVQNTLAEPLGTEVVLVACDRLSAAPTDSALSGVRDLLTRDALERRLRHELATAPPTRQQSIDIACSAHRGERLGPPSATPAEAHNLHAHGRD
jgi:hypothetical protein